MNIQPPPISPRQMNLLRVVLSMAWADETLEQKEVDVMLSRFSQLFATAPDQQAYLQSQLKEYFVQDIPLEEAASKITNEAEKELVLRLSYEVINASARTPEEAKVNQAESAAYSRLIAQLNLPEDIVKRAEQKAAASFNQGGGNVIDMLAYQLRDHLATL
ncbi:MAG: TerB family tellurite resistance protein [Cyanobacteria bacterium J06629_19]